MKKVFLSIFAILSVFAIAQYKSNAQSPFYQAVKTCEAYEQYGSISYQGETFNLKITLEKTLSGKCVYKEKIYQAKNYQMLTCNFDKAQLPFISDSMERFNNTFKKEIAQNKIFEAKLTTNGEVFQKYLADHDICQITHSKKKL